MLKFEHTNVFNFENAFRGMRNAKDSWALSDSHVDDGSWHEPLFVIGPKDMELAKKLIKAGAVHRKFMRQIIVATDITGPRDWWIEFDTYKVGPTGNSCSTMHTLQKHEITPEMCDMNLKEYEDRGIDTGDITPYFAVMNRIRESLLHEKDPVIANFKREMLKKMLPEGFLQKRTLTFTYENLVSMCSSDQRRYHRLSYWRHDFMRWVYDLPYAKDLIFGDDPHYNPYLNGEAACFTI